MTTREASHAGSWYSHDEEVLHDQLSEWMQKAAEENAFDENITKRIKAIIAPHAGYRYSGPTAAHAYHHLQALDHVARVFVLGPSHHFYLKGCALSTAKSYETPFGLIEIDHSITNELMETGKFTQMSLKVDENEHSIEMHLPFIHKVMNGRKFTLVPILVGNTTQKLNEQYGSIFAPHFEDPSNLFVISSDFCHWGSRFRYQPHDKTYGEIHEYIKYLDHEGIGHLERLDPWGFMQYLDKTNNTICGRHPISLLLHTIGSLEKMRCTLRLVKYAQSSACKNESDSSVSYASAIIYHHLS